MFLRFFFPFFLLFFSLSYGKSCEGRNGIQDSFRKEVAIKKDRRLNAKKRKWKNELYEKKYIYSI